MLWLEDEGKINFPDMNQDLVHRIPTHSTTPFGELQSVFPYLNTLMDGGAL